MVSLIYFDNDQLEDYLLDPAYREAYDMILDEVPIFIWTGRQNEDFVFALNESSEYVKLEKSEISKVLIRGKDIPLVTNVGLELQYINPMSANYILDDKVKCKDLIRSVHLIPTLKLKQLIKGVKYVIKPVDGLKGNDIVISNDLQVIKNQAEVIQSKYENGYLIEPFIKAKPFLNNEVYDLRFVIVGNNCVLVTLRTPAEGSELCNVAQGGFLKVLNLEDIPHKIIDQVYSIAGNISNKLRNNNLVYAIDVILGEDGYLKVFEFNTYPGIRKEYTKYLKALRSMLIKKKLPNKRKKLPNKKGSMTRIIPNFL